MGVGKTTCVFSLPSLRNATPGIWFEYSGAAPDFTQLGTLSNAIASAFDASAYQNDLDSTCVLTKVESQLFEVVAVPVSPTYPYGRRNSPTTAAAISTNTPFAGGAVGTLFPSPQVAMRVTLQTILPGKSFRGRVYLPGLAENSLDEAGKWTSGAVTEASGFVADWLDAIVASAPVTLTPVVHGLALPSDTEVSSIVGRDYAGTQRRRIKLVS